MYEQFYSYFGILHGNYIYLFENIKDDDEPYEWIYIRSSLITKLDEKDYGDNSYRVIDELIN